MSSVVETTASRRTLEQLDAACELTAAAPGYRVKVDPEGWPYIPGRYGRIEHLGAGQLAAYTDRRLIRSRLLALPGVTAHQIGDEELRALVTRQAVPAVAELLRCRKRRGAPAHGFQARPRVSASVQEAS
jgi:hypothetical protein